MPAALDCPVARTSWPSVGELVTISPQGPLDLSTADVLRSAVLRSLAEQPAAVIVDLLATVITDDLALTLFATMARRAQAWPGCLLVVCNVSDPARRGMAVLDPEQGVSVCDSWADAARAAGRAEAAPSRAGRYRPSSTAPSAARALAAAACRDWSVGAATGHRIQVIVTELVTNSVVHAGTPIELVLRCGPRFVHVCVRDGCVREPRLVAAGDGIEATGGRGLRLVEAFAHAWGCTPTRDGKVTWATVKPARDGGFAAGAVGYRG